MDQIVSILAWAERASPLAIIALLAVVIVILARSRLAVERIQSNDLTHVVGMLDRIHETLRRIEVAIAEQSVYIRAKWGD